MARRKIIWHPLRGVDRTRPKTSQETKAALESQVVDYAYDASELSIYNSKDIVVRRDLKAYDSVDYDAVYGICKYTRGLGVAGTSGIYLEGVLLSSQSLSSYVYMSPWYETLYWSDGSSWGKITSDDTEYDLGIAPDTSWTVATPFLSLYTNPATGATGYTTSSTGSWTQSTLTLTDASGIDSSVLGQYIQVYGASDSNCFTGIIDSVPTGTTLTVSISAGDTAAVDDASGAITYYISPNLIKTKYQFDQDGYAADYSITQIYYKYRFYRSGDGARSNTITADYSNFWSYIGIGTLVGGKEVTGLPASHSDTSVDKVEVFRLDTSSASSDLYRLTQTVDIGTTSVEDTTMITSALTALDDDEKYPAAQALENIKFYGNRLWGTYLNRLYYSEPFVTEAQFQYFGAAGLNYFDFPDLVLNFHDYSRTLVVMLERETWVLEGITPSAMVKRILNPDVGTYGKLSSCRYKGVIFSVSADMKFYQIQANSWNEAPHITSVLPSNPDYVQLIGSDDSLWISTGDEVFRFKMSNADLWRYDLEGYLGTGSHTTYLGQSGFVYQVDALNGSESTPSTYIESPEIWIGNEAGLRGKVNRILFRATCENGLIRIYVDGSLWKTITFSTDGEETVIKHFYPAQGYYVKVRLEATTPNDLTLHGPIILNPW